MANLTDAHELVIHNGLTGVSTLFTPTVYLALFTASPTEAGLVTNELSGNGYARASLNGKFTSGTQGNTSQISFAAASADWPTITHLGFMKSGTQGTSDMMMYGLLDAPISIMNTQSFIISIGALVVAVD